MDVLVDSNILVFVANPSAPPFAETTLAISTLLNHGERLCVLPQNLIEFWAVATRPIASRGLGFSVAQTLAEVARIKSVFQLLDDAPTIYAEWETLVTRHAVLGKNVHDARLVAAMRVFGLATLLTYNKADFKRFPGITFLEPKDVK